MGRWQEAGGWRGGLGLSRTQTASRESMRLEEVCKPTRQLFRRYNPQSKGKGIGLLRAASLAQFFPSNVIMWSPNICPHPRPAFMPKAPKFCLESVVRPCLCCSGSLVCANFYPFLCLCPFKRHVFLPSINLLPFHMLVLHPRRIRTTAAHHDLPPRTLTHFLLLLLS